MMCCKCGLFFHVVVILLCLFPNEKVCVYVHNIHYSAAATIRRTRQLPRSQGAGSKGLPKKD